jgi:hypothetical protein
MLKLSGVPAVVLYVLASVAFAGAEKPIGDLKTLAGEWRSVGNVTPAAIHINEDGTYQGIAASGAKTTGRIYSDGWQGVIPIDYLGRSDDVIRRERHRCAGPQPPISNVLSFEIDLI